MRNSRVSAIKSIGKIHYNPVFAIIETLYSLNCYAIISIDTAIETCMHVVVYYSLPISSTNDGVIDRETLMPCVIKGVSPRITHNTYSL